MKCKNPECDTKVDVLHMDDEGYCNDCHDKILDGLLIEESDETRFLSDRSLNAICTVKIGAKFSRSSTNFRKKPFY